MTKKFCSSTSRTSSGELTLISWSFAASGTFSCLPEEKSSTTVTSHSFSRKRSATWEPMKPAPPVTRTLGIEIGSLRGRQVRFCFGDRVGVLSRTGVSSLSECKEVSRGVHDSESATIRGRGLESHTRLVQELIHQRSRKVLERSPLFS